MLDERINIVAKRFYKFEMAPFLQVSEKISNFSASFPANLFNAYVHHLSGSLSG
jgi:hypothetical protein